MSEPNVCATKVSGRFAIIIPSPPPPPDDEVKETEAEKRVVKKRKMKKMEGEADKGVALDTTWIGRSKMPSASMVRTQPALEQEYAP
ncbi:hypothetical protein Patl1_00545 [Pistacia atlantica]|uniref:Uncharacterized protein n=1 Tax=Pistacia atlantica TaxID=434234 RepID=A0ACC1C692_9ROSI|nr:hypothetical protein Patl1_00545 [Pistacia atlantica]